MLMRKDNSTVPACSIFKYAALILLASISCLDFQFESEYEDINGIYLEFLTYYQYGGQKLLFRGDTGYISRYDSLLAYDFTRADSINLLDIYTPGAGYLYEIRDFLFEDEYAFLMLPSGLQIVDLSSPQPHIVGTLALQYPAYQEKIKKSGDYLYITADRDFIIADVTETANPLVAGTYSFDNTIRDLEIDSSFAYILSGQGIQILEINDPSAPNLICSLSYSDTIPRPLTFSKKGSYLYVSARHDPDSNFLMTYDLSIDHTLTKVSKMMCPHTIRYIDAGAQYMLALSDGATFLLNLEYPSRPCFGEMATPGGDYGIIRNNYLYALNFWSLVIFEIRQVE
jgi:hypothetical protein